MPQPDTNWRDGCLVSNAFARSDEYAHKHADTCSICNYYAHAHHHTNTYVHKHTFTNYPVSSHQRDT